MHTRKVAVLENVASRGEEPLKPPNIVEGCANHTVPIAFGTLIWPVIADLGVCNAMPPAKSNRQVTPTGGVQTQQFRPMDNAQASEAFRPNLD